MNWKSLLVATPFWRNNAMALVRMLLGALLILSWPGGFQCRLDEGVCRLG